MRGHHIALVAAGVGLCAWCGSVSGFHRTTTPAEVTWAVSLGAVVAADLVLQRAVARKYASGAARRFSLTVGLTLPRRAFLPPPHVDSAVLVVRRRR